MIRRVLSLSLLSAALLAGCIENPGLDPGLAAELKRETLDFETPFRQANMLRLRLTRESDRVSLKGTHVGLEDFDSASVLVRLYPPIYSISGQVKMYFNRPELEIYRRIGALAPGDTFDFGPVESLKRSFGDLEGQAALIQVWQDGVAQGSVFAGVYSGSHTRWKDPDQSNQGNLQGTVDADGRFNLTLYSPGQNHPVGQLAGMVREDGSLGPRFWMHPGDRGNGGHLARQGTGFEGSFLLEPEISSFDSVTVRCEPYSHR